MPVVLVANPKGGVGKSTLATNIAGYFASRGHAVMLGDVDRQQSSRLWLGLRPPQEHRHAPLARLARLGLAEHQDGLARRPVDDQPQHAHAPHPGSVSPGSTVA